MDHNACKVFGRNMKRYRDQLHITQEELALRCNTSSSHLGYIERGQRNPTLETVERIAIGLGVTPDMLLAPDPPSGAEAAAETGILRQLAAYAPALTQLPPEQGQRIIAMLGLALSVASDSP